MKEKEEVEKRKAEQAAKAKQKRIAKKVANDKCTVNCKCHQTKIIESSSSSDETEEEMVLNDDSSTDESGEESDVFMKAQLIIVQNVTLISREENAKLILGVIHHTVEDGSM